MGHGSPGFMKVSVFRPLPLRGRRSDYPMGQYVPQLNARTNGYSRIRYADFSLLIESRFANLNYNLVRTQVWSGSANPTPVLQKHSPSLPA
jgi:hypothetical protein